LGQQKLTYVQYWWISCVRTTTTHSPAALWRELRAGHSGMTLRSKLTTRKRRRRRSNVTGCTTTARAPVQKHASATNAGSLLLNVEKNENARGDSDVIPSTIVTAAVLAVYSVAAV